MTTTLCLNNIPGLEDLINGNTPYKSVLKLNKTVSENQDYAIIRYDKNFLNVDLIPTYGLCRSVVVNSKNEIVSFSPPKSIRSEDFIRNYPNKTDDILAMEFVEGTMMNVFWDKTTLTWVLSTRNTVGANSSFFVNENKITFSDMFWEAVKENNLNMEMLNKNNCYSFVLQHPKNRIVLPFKKPQLYLVGCYTIDKLTVHCHSIASMQTHDWSPSTIRFPQIYSWENYSELIDAYASMNSHYDIMGVVLYNSVTGERAKIRNPLYEEVKYLRGNQPKLQYQYLCLRRENRVKEFLTYYPEYKHELSDFRNQVHLFTNTLYSNYVSCYIKKEKPLLEFPKQFRTHMFYLHQMYMNELREKQLYITNTTVIQYVNKLHPSLLMYCLNYHMRKRSVDLIKME